MDVDVYSIFYNTKVDIEDELDKIIEFFFIEKKDKNDFEREFFKKVEKELKFYGFGIINILKEKKRREKYREKWRDEKEKYRDKYGDGILKYVRDEYKFVVKDKDSFLGFFRERSRDESLRFSEVKLKEKFKENLEKEKVDLVKFSNGSDKLFLFKDVGRKDVRFREKFFGDGDLMMISFERMFF